MQASNRNPNGSASYRQRRQASDNVNGNVPTDEGESARHRGIANNPASSTDTPSAAHSGPPRSWIREHAPVALDTAVYIRIFILLLQVLLGEKELIKAFGSFVAVVVARFILSYSQEYLVVAPLAYLFGGSKTTQLAPPDGSQARSPSGEHILPSLPTGYEEDPPPPYFELHPFLSEVEGVNNGSISWEDILESPPSMDNPPPDIHHRPSEDEGRQPTPVQAPSQDSQPETDDLLSDLRLQLAKKMTAGEYDPDLMRSRTPEQLNTALNLLAFIRRELERLRHDDPALWRRTHEQAEEASAELEWLLEMSLAILTLDEGRKTRRRDAAGVEDVFEPETWQRRQRQRRYYAAVEWSSERLRELFDLGDDDH